ncbi:unnamed protein product [Merluccius merluccius]
MKLIDLRDAMPAGFTPILQTLDTKEPALRKKRLCVKLSPRASAQTALYDIQVISKSKLPHTNYTCIGGVQMRRRKRKEEEELYGPERETQMHRKGGELRGPF